MSKDLKQMYKTIMDDHFTPDSWRCLLSMGITGRPFFMKRCPG
jgi:hypothetical protein